DRALTKAGFGGDRECSVLDAGCGQGYFAAFYRERYPAARYVGLDVSERAVAHLRRAEPRSEFHLGNVCDWRDPNARRFDVVQGLDLMYLILDDELMTQAVANLAAHRHPEGWLIVNAALPAETRQPRDYPRYGSGRFWEDLVARLGLRIVAELPMYYWLPAGGPANRYLRFIAHRLGPAALYGVDRAALALGLPSSRATLDCRM